MIHPAVAYDPVADRIISKAPVFARDISGLSSYIRGALRYGERVGATRIAIRAIIPTPLYKPAIEHLHHENLKSEAEIPLEGRFAHRVLVYLGRNAPNRVSSDYILAEQEKLLRRILCGERLSRREIEHRLHKRPYRVEFLTGDISRDDRNRILEIYRESFHRYQQYDFDSRLSTMLSSPGLYTLAAIRGLEDHRIHAFCNTYHTSVDLVDGGALRLAEFDNCVKSQAEDAPRALAMHLRLSLAHEAFTRGADLCFCESRAVNGGINGASHRLGMRFCGSLPQHIVIAGPSDIALDKQGVYEDFNVWSLSRELFEKRLGKG